MAYDLNKCPECGYVNNKQPDICPNCGCNLEEYRAKIRAQMWEEAQQIAEKERNEKLEETYKNAIGLFNNRSFKEAQNTFMALGDYKESLEFAEKCKEEIYQIIIKEFNKNLFLKNLISQEESFDYFNTPFVQDCRKKYSKYLFEIIKSKFEEYEDYKPVREYTDYCDKAIELFSLYDEQEADYKKYCKAVTLYNEKQYEKAMVMFKKLEGVLDSEDFISKCQDAMYQHASQTLDSGNCEAAVEEFKKILQNKDGSDANDFVTKYHESMYQNALRNFNSGNYKAALEVFKKIPEYKDVSDYIPRIQIEVARIEEERNKRKAEKEAKQREINSKERKTHIVVYSCNLILCMIFGIILFFNKEQISIISSFGWWCVGWVVFTLVSIATSGAYLREACTRPLTKDFKDHKKTPLKVIIAMVLCSIVAVGFLTKLELGFDPTKCVTITATDKEDSIGGKYYDSVITFDLQNTSNLQVKYIMGEMTFYNGENEVASYNTYFQGEYNAGKSYQTTIEFHDKNSALYDVSFSNLKITYRITAMKFNDDYEEREYNGETVIIKELR